MNKSIVVTILIVSLVLIIFGHALDEPWMYGIGWSMGIIGSAIFTMNFYKSRNKSVRNSVLLQGDNVDSIGTPRESYASESDQEEIVWEKKEGNVTI
jgi:hypothetical protein